MPKYKGTYINLDRREDRNGVMQKNWDGIVDISRFKAIEHAIGSYGNYQSHRTIIEGLEKDNKGLCIIMEDDIIPCGDFEKRLDMFIKELPADWDIFMLGFFSTERSQFAQVSEHIHKANSQICASHCYIVNPNSYQKVLDEFDNPDHENNIDVLLMEFQKKANVYISIPCFCYQYHSFSDNSNSNMDLVSKQTKIYFKEWL